MSYGYDAAGYINVSQYCAINTSELDRLEYADASATVISNVFNVLNDIISNERIAPYVDNEAFAAYAESLLDGLAGASQIINVPKNTADAKGNTDNKVFIPPNKKTD